MQSLKGYRTIGFNVIMAILMLARAMNPEVDLPDRQTVEGAVDGLTAGLASFWAVGNVILRAVTTSPIFKKEPKS